MVDKNDNWSVNSGKWAYSKEASHQAEVNSHSSRNISRRLAYLAAIAVFGLAVLQWIGALQSLSGMLPSSFWSKFSQRPTSSMATDPQQGLGNSDLEEENARLKADLAEKQRQIDEQKRIIDQRQPQREQEATQFPAEYTVAKRSTATLHGKQFFVIAEHQFVSGKDHWTQASCYVAPEINGVKYSIDLIRRDQPDYLPNVRLATTDTLSRASLSWPDVFDLGSHCPWMDGASYAKEELSGIALSEAPEATGPGDQAILDQAILEPLLQPTREPSVPARDARQLYRSKDMVGMDIKRLSGISQTECEALCINDSSCVGYTYDNWNRLCIPKSGIGRLRLEPRSTTVILSDAKPTSSNAPPMMTPRRERAFPDPAYHSALTASYEVCSDMCLQDSACLGVNFIALSSQCRFFAQPSEYGPRAGVMLGYKSQRE